MALQLSCVFSGAFVAHCGGGINDRRNGLRYFCQQIPYIHPRTHSYVLILSKQEKIFPKFV